MNQELLKEITQGQIKAEKAAFKVGDGVRVHTKVREGDKERIQIFAGIVIARKGSGIHETFTVRRFRCARGSTICATALAAKLPRLRKRESKLFRHKGFPLRREVLEIKEIALKGGYPFMGAGFILRPFFMRKIALGLENMAEGFRILFGYKIQIIFSVFLCLF